MTSKTPTPEEKANATAEMFKNIANYGGGPAHPMQMQWGLTDGVPNIWFAVGLTKREQFAAMMMAGMYANSSAAWLAACGNEAKNRGEKTTEETFARIAVEAADCLLERLKK